MGALPGGCKRGESPNQDHPALGAPAPTHEHYRLGGEVWSVTSHSFNWMLFRTRKEAILAQVLTG